jgi:hypothetical protein
MTLHFGLDRERLEALGALELFVSVYANEMVLETVKCGQRAVASAAHVILALLHRAVVFAVAVLAQLLLLGHRFCHH